MAGTTLDVRDEELVRSGLFIDGSWGPASRDGKIPVHNPADGSWIADVADGSREDAQRAIQAADRALPKWAGLTATTRAAVLRLWYELIVENADELAAIMTAEQGKPLGEAKGEVLYGAGFVEWFAEEGKRAYGEMIPPNVRGRRLLVLRQPVGVVGAITPWNFPAAMILRKAGPALAAGCTMVLKPASETPLSALALAELARRAGVPAGVFNVVTGPPEEIGGELATNPIVRKLTFTGSTEIGKLLMGQCAGTLKQLSLELGGNSPLLVFDDADVDNAVEGAIASKFRNNGQTCVCANRVLVQAGVYDEFVRRFAAAAAAMRVGNGADGGVDLGPLISDKALQKVEEHVADAVAQGAAVLTGGERHALGGTFYEPTVLSDVTGAMRITREETFGPVAPIMRFETEEEAIQMANDTESGLAAYVFSRDLGRVWRVGEALQFGVVAVNTGAFSYEGAPFGGMKESGFGREGSHHALEDFLDIKYFCVDGIGS
jgi:succinate-semialdehyde dehydrogenase / glutarate-semialdehyde dehydrogenase